MINIACCLIVIASVATLSVALATDLRGRKSMGHISALASRDCGKYEKSSVSVDGCQARD